MATDSTVSYAKKTDPTLTVHIYNVITVTIFKIFSNSAKRFGNALKSKETSGVPGANPGGALGARAPSPLGQL